MIVKGVVSEEELHWLRRVLGERGPQGATPDLKTWSEESEDGPIHWIEADVHDDILDYLKRTGFFDDR